MTRRRHGGEWLVVVFLSLAPGIYSAALDGSSPQFNGIGAHSGVRRSLLQANAPPLPFGNNTVLDCNVMNPNGVLFNLSLTADVFISNVTFQNCPSGALYLSTSNSNSSTALIATFRNCRFIKNSYTDTTNSTNTTTTTTTTSASAGGALTITGRITARIIDCTFLNNSATMGGAVLSTAGNEGVGSLQVVGSLFQGNSGQGAAVYVHGGALVGLERSNFTFNRGGSAVYLENVREPSSPAGMPIMINQTVFSDNSADGDSSLSWDMGGGLRVDGNLQLVSISNCTFVRNSAQRQGGAIAVYYGGEVVTLSSVTLYDNFAGLYGGALSASMISTVTMLESNFAGNTATQGGAIYLSSMAVLVMDKCNLIANNASKFGGAVSATTGSSLTAMNSTFLRNQASFAGAVECWSCASVTASMNSFLLNSANSSAGALAVYSATSTVILNQNVFRNNTAARMATTFTTKECSRSSLGAGGAVCASITTALFLINNTFEGNVATSGGAIFTTRQCEIQADDSTCESATLNMDGDNYLYGNVAAGGAGGAVYALNISAVAIVCSDNGTETSYVASELSTWPYGTTGCSGRWYGNSAIGGGYGSGIATGLAGIRQATNAGSSLTDVSSNSPLNIVLVLYDYMGTAITRGTYEADGTTVAVWTSPTTNLSRYLTSGYSVSTSNGVANFTSLQLRAPPGTYNLSFYALPIGVSDRKLYKWARLPVEIRPCGLGEVSQDSGEECTECSGPNYYGFNAQNVTCDECPDYASCNFNGSRANVSTDAVGYLVPEDGYWHSSPFSPQMHSCPFTAACTFDGRTYSLGFFQESNLSDQDAALPTPVTSILYDITHYWQMQCATGYRGRVCAQCVSPKYGWRSSGRCYKCPPLALNTLFYCLSYLLTVLLLAWTVRAVLGRSLGASRALASAARNTGRLGAGGKGGEEGGKVGGFMDGSEYDGKDGVGGGGGSKRGVSINATAGFGAGGLNLGRRSRTASGSGGGEAGGSRRVSFGTEGATGKHNGRPATVGGSSSSRKGGGGASGVLELAAATALAQLEAEEAARKAAPGRGRDGGSGGGADDEYDNSSGAALQPAVLPGRKPSAQDRVPRSVRTRESRLAPGGGGGDGSGGGGAAAITRALEVSDVSDGEQSAAAMRRHRLSRMSRATPEKDGGYGSGGSGGSSGGSSTGSSGGGGGGAAAGPVAEGLSSCLEDAGNGSGGGEDDARAWAGGGGIRRRKAAAAAEEGGGGGGVAAFSELRPGSPSTPQDQQHPHHHHHLHGAELRAQLKEDELEREEKPPHAVVLKIMVNFLQVTSVARKLDLDFPDSIDRLWSVGSMASSAMTTLVSLDCSLPDNGVSKALQRTLLLVMIPFIFILFALPIWLLLYVRHLREHRKPQPEQQHLELLLQRPPPPPPAAAGKSGREVAEAEARVVPFEKLSESERDAAAAAAAADGAAAVAAVAAVQGGPWAFRPYLTTRMVVTAIAVVFYFYPSVTDTLLSIFQCDQLDEATGAYAGYVRSVGSYWEYDFDLYCFRDQHLVLTLVVGVPGLVLWCVGVPVGSALWLRHNAVRGRLNQPLFSDRYGFLYEDYRRTTYFWESVIMARKLLVVGLLLATNSSDDIMQVLAVMGVVVIAGILQLYVKPFEQPRFNKMESFSLGSTLIILYLCCFFLLDDLTQSAKQALSVAILLANVGTICWFVYCMVTEAWWYGVRVLDSDGDGKVSRAELRAWLKITLGPLATVVLALAAPPWRRQRLLRGGDSDDSGDKAGVAAPSGKEAAEAEAEAPRETVGAPPPPPPPLVSSGQQQTPAAAAAASAPVLFAPSPSTSRPPSPPPSVQWTPVQPPPAQVRLPAPSSSGQSGAVQAGEPVNESYTAVTDIRTSQDLAAASDVAASSGGGAGGALYGTRRPSGSLFSEAPPVPNRRRSSGANPVTGSATAAGGGVGASVLPGSTASVCDDRGGGAAATSATAASARLLVEPLGTLPGSPLAESRRGTSRPGTSTGSRGADGGGGGSEVGNAIGGPLRTTAFLEPQALNGAEPPLAPASGGEVGGAAAGTAVSDAGGHEV